MKKGLKILAIMVLALMSIPCVKAEEDTTTYIFNIDRTEKNKPTEEIINNIYTNVENITNGKNYIILQDVNYNYSLLYFEGNNYNTGVYNGEQFNFYSNDVNAKVCNNIETNNYTCTDSSSFWITQINDNIYRYYDSNIEIVSNNNIELTNFYNDNIIISIGKNLPKLKDLYNYNSWSDYENEHLEGYTEVNLDNYEYVLLSLKNYNQTKAFQTNLQVKGQIGITPIYNYGQTSKDSITGAQVQDRCNVTYENYTNYPFYIIQTDLQNNVIYAVKECSNGSSFKFDNSIFDITYVTEENKNNPTVTINGKTYNVIPYDDLPSTATKNEEDNYIPGESGQANSTGGLDSAIKGTQQKMSEIWNTFTYFTDFINQIFSILPDEVKTILLSAFTIMIIIGLIKIFIN